VPAPLLSTPSALKWRSILEGAEMAVVSGNPESSGMLFVIRFRTDREIPVPAHWHQADEHITVLEGPYSFSLGDRFDVSRLIGLPPGSHVFVPKGTCHFALYGPGTLVQVSGVGPFQSYYVDPDDDGRAWIRRGASEA
jgi:quercetin dioxygenase-like cupin family protein